MSKPNASDESEPRWDWTATLLVVLAVVLLMVLTFEMWAPHVGVHR